MNKRELNRDYKRLWKRFKTYQPEQPASDDDYLEWESCKKELKRLYFSDRGMDYINLNSLKILLIMNRKLRVIPLHQLGTHINTDKL
jgi:hypothetical protein